MNLMEQWRSVAYNEATGKEKLQQLWAAYFQEEKEIYAQLLKNPDEVVKGTVKELADKFKVSLMTMTGFLDGINDSLVEQNPIDDLEEDTQVNLGFDKALLYKNMVAAEADWLYNLEEWNAILEEDPRIEEVASCLAGANCGGCGYASCADYAKAVVMDGVPCDKCAPGGPKAAAAIAKIMGGEASAVEKKAVVQCQGNTEHCKPSYDYKGIQTCAAAAALYGGPKTWSFACIGLGDCTKVCKFDAIHIVDGVAKVDKDKCTGCGACVNTCPKKVIMIDAAGPRKPVVMCSNQDKGAVANKVCTTSCIACGMCERTCKFDAIHVVDGVARIDYDKCKGCGMCAQKCPKKIILFPLKDDPYPPKPVVKPAAPAAAKPAAPAAPAEKPETKAE